MSVRCNVSAAAWHVIYRIREQVLPVEILGGCAWDAIYNRKQRSLEYSKIPLFEPGRDIVQHLPNLSSSLA
jgi:hypothetical protein